MVADDPPVPVVAVDDFVADLATLGVQHLATIRQLLVESLVALFAGALVHRHLAPADGEIVLSALRIPAERPARRNQLMEVGLQAPKVEQKIGRASGRERVCPYV